MPRDAVTVRRNGPYAPLSAFYADDDAIARLDMAEDDRTELLFLRGLAFCARDPNLRGCISLAVLETGRVLRRTAGLDGRTIIDHAEELVKLGLWQSHADGYRITRWSKWNRSPTEIKRARAKDNARKPAKTAPGTPPKGGTDNAA
jgi:hypothetical protein